MKQILWGTFITIAVSACSSWQDSTDDNHAAICKELKRQIIFNGATQNQPRASANQPLATQQRAQLDRANQSYNQLGC